MTTGFAGYPYEYSLDFTILCMSKSEKALFTNFCMTKLDKALFTSIFMIKLYKVVFTNIFMYFRAGTGPRPVAKILQPYKLRNTHGDVVQDIKEFIVQIIKLAVGLG